MNFLGWTIYHYFDRFFVYFIVSFRYRSLLQSTLAQSQSIQIQQSFRHTSDLTLSTSTWVMASIPSWRKRLHFSATAQTLNFGANFNTPSRRPRSFFTAKSIVRSVRVSLTWQGYWCIWATIFFKFLIVAAAMNSLLHWGQKRALLERFWPNFFNSRQLSWANLW